MATEMVVCMGSACFSRGNAGTLGVIQGYLETHGLQEEVKVTGTLCQNNCRQGPNLTINGECVCGVKASSLPDLLDERLGQVAGEAP